MSNINKQIKAECNHVFTNYFSVVGTPKLEQCVDCGLYGAELQASMVKRDKDRKAALEAAKSCEMCGGHGGGTWNGNEHGPFENYMPCYGCGV
jgi:hypothetical protein